MAADREWFCIERPDGTNVGPAPSYPNRDAATAAARLLAPESNVPLTIVRYSRREVRTIQRNVTISETDIGTATPA